MMLIILPTDACLSGPPSGITFPQELLLELPGLSNN